MSRTTTPFRRVGYSQPTWPLLVWQGNRKRDKQSAVRSALATVTGVSKRRVRQTHLDTIRKIIEINPRVLKEFAAWLRVEKSTLVRKRNR